MASGRDSGVRHVVAGRTEKSHGGCALVRFGYIAASGMVESCARRRVSRGKGAAGGRRVDGHTGGLEQDG